MEENVTKFEDVKDLSTKEYFQGNQFSIDAFEKKYAASPEETYVQAVKRVCDFIASVESTQELREYWSNRWFDEIFNDWWHPAGSIMQGAGSGRKISLANCTATSLGKNRDGEEWDSLEAIIRNSSYTIAKCAAYRQGLGTDFSRLRPRGTRVSNSANQSTGAVHWMEYTDKIGYYVGQCLHPNTNILTEHGYKTIKEIVETNYDGNIIGKDGIVKIINWFKNPQKEIFRLNLEYGDYIDASLDHKILVYDLKNDAHIEKKMGEISPGDYVICKRFNGTRKFVDNITFDHFKYELSEYNNSNRLFIPEKIPTILTPELSYILGIIYGDGCVYNETIEIAFSNNWPEILDKFNACIKIVFGCNVGECGINIKVGERNSTSEDCTRIILGKWFYNFFKHIECLKGTTKNLGFPKIFTNCNQSNLESFFAGLFDGDGYNSITKRNICLSLVDGDFLYNLKLHLQKFGYVMKLRKKIRPGYEPCFNLSAVGKASLEKISEIDSIKIQQGNLMGKYDRLKTPFRAKSLNINPNLFRDINEKDPFSDSKYIKYTNSICDLYIQKVESVIKNGESITYDITVDSDDHLFCAQSILLKNSGRIPAMLFSISCDHPDVEEFIQIKSDYTKIQNANISVQCTEKFYKAIENDEDWELKFVIPPLKKGDKVYVDVHSIDMFTTKEKETGRYYKIATHDRKKEVFTKTVKARKLMELIAKNMHQNAEPGIQNIDVARKYSNSDAMYDPADEYDSRIIGTNACSEQYLSRESLCVLASINCGKFSTEEKDYIKQLEKISKSINRFLDNVNECELVYKTYATPHQELAIKKLRRTGAGVTNIAAWLFKKGLVYGSKDGNDSIEEFIKWFNYWLYISTEELGAEKGDFGLFNKDKWKSAPFVSRIIKESEKLNSEYKVPVLKGNHARNVTVSSIAPTGCIEENTRIVTNLGLIKIKNLVSNHPNENEFLDIIDNIQVSDEKGNTNIIKYYNNGVVDGYVIELEDGRIAKNSSTHRIRVLNDEIYEWKYSPDIIVGDIVISYLGADNDRSDYVKLNNKLVSEHHNISSITLPTVLDEQLAEYIGLFTGDGSIKFRSESGIVDGIRFPVFSEDKDLADYIIDLTRNLFSLNCNCSFNKNKRIYEITTHSINLGNYLINNGLEKKKKISTIKDGKSHVYHIPEAIFRSKKSVIAAYLRGLFESDGDISEGCISLYSKYKHITAEVQELLMYLGIQSYLGEIDKLNAGFNNKMYRVTIRFKNDKLKFRNIIGFISNRKNQLLNEFEYEIDREKIYINISLAKNIQSKLSSIITSKSKLYSKLTTFICNNKDKNYIFINRDTLNEIGKYIDLSSYFPFKLENYVTSKVKRVYREKMQTYDIEVSSENHTYITSNGLINHNTISLMFRDFILSYGIEPAFFMYFWKRTRMAGKYEYYFCVPRVIKEMFAQAGYPIPMDCDSIRDDWKGSKGIPIAKFIDEHRHNFKFKESTEINPMDKLQLMSQVMKWIDSSISVTYMLPIGSTWKDVYNFILEAHKKEVKSIAAFPDKKMYGVVSSIPFKALAFKLKDEGIGIHHQNFSDEELKELNLSRENITPKAFDYPKRPSSLDADIYVVSVKGEKFVIVVGLQNNQPYEIFGGHVNGFGFKFTNKKGKITKVKRGQYALEIGDVVIEDFSKQFTPTEQILFRMASMAMRHGIPIQFVVEQLQKAQSDITSMGAAAARCLKKYIIDGTQITGQKCPNCGKDLVYIEGCSTCTECGHSKCG